MARPRRFDEDGALDAAMHTFWANGYEATSTEDLCTATGLGRSSIYNTFSSKHELFRRSLTRYIERVNADQFAILDDETRPVRERVEALFERIIDDTVTHQRDGHGIGCLVLNSTMELSGRDAEATDILQRDLRLRLDHLAGVLETGQRTGEIATDRDARTLAQYVNAVIGGLRIAGHGDADPAPLRAIAATAMEALTARSP